MRAERVAWLERVLALDPGRLVFLDETAATTTMDRTHGRAASGKRVDGPVPHGHYKTTTLTAAIRLDGVVEPACMAFEGATNAATFEFYVERSLAPSLRPGDVVILDNLSSHKSAAVERLVAAAGATVCFLPPYSPDFNPIEAMFGKLKAFLRAAKARTFEALLAALGEGLRTIRPGDILGWFARCGYRALTMTTGDAARCEIPRSSTIVNRKPL